MSSGISVSSCLRGWRGVPEGNAIPGSTRSRGGLFAAAAIFAKQRNRNPDHCDRDRRQPSAEDRHEEREREVIHNPGMAGSILTQIEREVGSWDGVTVSAHRFGRVEFRVGRRELGHLHGNYLADLPFPVPVRKQLVAAGKAETLHILPASGWVSYRIASERDIPSVIELFRLNYERPWAAT